MTYTRVSSNNVTWEVARKHDLGFDLYLWGDKFGLTVDYFDEKREGIYMTRSYLPDMVGIQGENPAANVGSVKTKGFDGNFKFDQRVGDVGLQIRNFTYSKNKITEADEMVSRYPYLRRTGFRIDQAKGLIALGLFEDYEDIRNSPRQDFADPRDVMPGDIKYKDINGDGIINNDDIVPIGSTTRPNLIYGLGLSAMWKVSILTCISRSRKISFLHRWIYCISVQSRRMGQYTGRYGKFQPLVLGVMRIRMPNIRD